MNQKATVTLLVMALNEIDGMKQVMPRIDRSLFEQILVVDGGSTDGTREWARDNGFTVFEQVVPGLRQGYNEVMGRITGDIIITFSPDGNCLASLLPALIAKAREGHDLVIASRYLGGAKSYDDDLVTAFGNWLFTRTVNLLFGSKMTDVMVIYRAFKKGLVYDLALHEDAGYARLEKLFFTRLSWEPLMSCRAAKKKVDIAEIPGDEPYRIGGVRKLQIIRWGAAYYSQFWRELFF